MKNFLDANIILWQGHAYTKVQLEEHLQLQCAQNREAWEKELLLFTLEWLDEKKEEFQVSTSGSTGNAKQITLSREQMILSALATGAYLDLKAGDKALLTLPARFVAGKMMIVRALVLGLDLYYLSPQVKVLDGLEQAFQFCALIPLQLQYAMDHQGVENIEKIEKIIIGGAPLSQDDIARTRTVKSQIWATYGMTETITHIAMKKLNGNDASGCYSCLPGINVDSDEQDRLRIYSDRLPLKVTRTNDRVHLISDSAFEVLGRADFVINSGGLKIQPEEIEEKLRSLFEVALMIGYRADEALGQKLVLMLEGQETQVDLVQIGHQMRALLPKNWIPKEIVFVEELFRTENQKLDRPRNLSLL